MMRSQTFVLWVFITALVSACDFWPERLETLEDSISRDVTGEVMAWRLGRDVVIVEVANSALYHGKPAELEAAATGIAEQAVAIVALPLESVSVTFHEGEVSEEADKMRQFIFLIKGNQPVLQPLLDHDAKGPLKRAEFQAFLLHTVEPLSQQRKKCVLTEIENRADAAGDPEKLNPADVEFLPTESWPQLDPVGRRLILAQAIYTKAFMVCGESGEYRALP